MRCISGAFARRASSIQCLRHKPSLASSTISPSNSCRPIAEPAYRRVISARNVGARFVALSAVARLTVMVASSAMIFFKSAVARGVVVTQACGASPRRKPNCSMSHALSARRHFASSSHQAAENCGPRSASASSAENNSATAPFGHVRRRFDGSKSGLSLAGWTLSNPETPSTMTLRTSARVLPTSAILFGCAPRLAFREPAARGMRAPRLCVFAAGNASNPFRSSAGLARTSAAKKHPHAPGLAASKLYPGGLRETRTGSSARAGRTQRQCAADTEAQAGRLSPKAPSRGR